MPKELDKARQLRAAVESLADDLKMKVANFAITPGKDEHDNDILNIVWLLTAESVETAEETEQRKIDAEFDALFGDQFDETTFADDETKALLDKEKNVQAQAKAELDKLLEEWNE